MFLRYCFCFYLVLFISCATTRTISGTKAYFDQHYRDGLVKRASFDLSCSADQLTLTPLGNQGEGYDVMGVQGCDKKVSYVLVNGKWVMNSDVKSTE